MHPKFLNFSLILLLSSFVLADLSGHHRAVKRETCSDSTEDVCDDHCMPSGAVCCHEGTGAYCPSGNVCLPNGCCPIGKTCFGPGGSTLTVSDSATVIGTATNTPKNTDTSISETTISEATITDTTISTNTPVIYANTTMTRNAPAVSTTIVTKTPTIFNNAPTISSATSFSQNPRNSAPNGRPIDLQIYVAMAFGALGYLLLR